VSAVRLALAATLAPLLSGCMTTPLMGVETRGALFREERLAALAPRKTTRAEVLEWFGPPLAFARSGAVAPTQEVAFRWTGPASDSWTSFDRFPAGEVAPDDLVYYYEATESVTNTSAVGLVIFFITGGKGGVSPATKTFENRTDKLWILIDGATGVVKAVVVDRIRPRPPAEAHAPRAPGRDAGAAA
jgi:hypothetical protein